MNDHSAKARNWAFEPRSELHCCWEKCCSLRPPVLTPAGTVRTTLGHFGSPVAAKCWHVPQPGRLSMAVTPDEQSSEHFQLGKSLDFWKPGVFKPVSLVFHPAGQISKFCCDSITSKYD